MIFVSYRLLSMMVMVDEIGKEEVYLCGNNVLWRLTGD